MVFPFSSEQHWLTKRDALVTFSWNKSTVETFISVEKYSRKQPRWASEICWLDHHDNLEHILQIMTVELWWNATMMSLWSVRSICLSLLWSVSVRWNRKQPRPCPHLLREPQLQFVEQNLLQRIWDSQKHCGGPLLGGISRSEIQLQALHDCF